jgi:hypothetical protein
VTSPPLLFIDCESTGTDPRWHDAWDLGVVPADGGEQLEYRFPVDLTHADPAALRIGGYYARAHTGERPIVRRWADDTTTVKHRPSDARTWDPANLTFLARRFDGATLVGVNPQFDAAFLAKVLRAAGLEPTWRYRLIDLNSMARGYLIAQPWAGAHPHTSVHRTPVETIMSLGSYDLSALCGVERPADHTALGDARWTRDWYTTMTTRPPEATS